MLSNGSTATVFCAPPVETVARLAADERDRQKRSDGNGECGGHCPHSGRRLTSGDPGLDALEIRADFRPARVAEVTSRLQGFADDGGQLARKIAIDRYRPVFSKRQPTCRHFVQHNAETPDIAASVRVEPAHLLRRHVLRRADDHARLRA